MSDLHVTCPVCREDIETPLVDGTFEGERLNVTLDPRGVDEHIEMHKRCCCRWTPDGRITAKECTEHQRTT